MGHSKAGVLLLICLCATGHAAMHNTFAGFQASEAEDILMSFQGRTEAHTDADSDASNVLIKYLVPPPVQKEFIEVFQSVKEETQKEEGCEDYYLLKPVTDNVTFYIFGRWTSQAAYAEHFKSAHTKKLLDFDQDKGIVFYIQPLLVVD
ncbi:TPA: hypothetical protein ACH3X2_003033 [Trebouxia sp. C0005]